MVRGPTCQVLKDVKCVPFDPSSAGSGGATPRVVTEPLARRQWAPLLSMTNPGIKPTTDQSQGGPSTTRLLSWLLSSTNRREEPVRPGTLERSGRPGIGGYFYGWWSKAVTRTDWASPEVVPPSIILSDTVDKEGLQPSIVQAEREKTRWHAGENGEVLSNPSVLKEESSYKCWTEM